MLFNVVLLEELLQANQGLLLLCWLDRGFLLATLADQSCNKFGREYLLNTALSL